MKSHKLYISKCLTLAKEGSGYTSPNPLVGCVIVKNGKIIGEGYHEKYGEAHAEINALNSCKENPVDATLYVNLEPCSHYGKTPPCVDAIIKANIKEVIIGTLDPNPKVAGQGIEKLKSNGIKVTVGILEDECKKLNEKYFYWIENKIPFVFLKVALSKNLLLASKDRSRIQVTSNESTKKVHQWRSEYDAMLVGTGTVIYDNPKLTVREVNGRQPFRLVLDREKKLDLKKYHLFTDKYLNRTIIFSDENIANEKYIEYSKKKNIKLIEIECKSNKLDIQKIIQKLPELNIYSLMIESGVELSKEMIEKKLPNKIAIFIGNKIIDDGDSPFIAKNIDDLIQGLNLKNLEKNTCNDDLLVEGYINK